MCHIKSVLRRSPGSLRPFFCPFFYSFLARRFSAWRLSRFYHGDFAAGAGGVDFFSSLCGAEKRWTTQQVLQSIYDGKALSNYPL